MWAIDGRRRHLLFSGSIVGVGAALAIAAVALIGAGHRVTPPIGDAIWVAVIVACAARMTLYGRIGSRRYAQSLTDTAIMLGLMLLPPVWMILSVATGVATAKTLARRPAGAVAVSAAKNAITVAVAAVVGAATSLGMPYQANARNLPALAAVGASIIAAHEATTVPLLALAGGQRVRDVFRKGAAARVGTAVLRISLAIAVGYLLRFDARLAIAAPLAALGLHFYYTNRVAQRADRRSWQQLACIADEIGSADEPAVHLAAIRGAASMFSCDEVELDIRLLGREPRLVRGGADGLTYDGPIPDGEPLGGVVHSAPMDTWDGARTGRTGEMRLLFRTPVAFGDREAYTLRALAATVGTAIRKTAAVAEAAQMASRRAQAPHRDSVTGLANRAFLAEHAGATTGRLGLAIIDINEFRQINDALGSTGGDRTLREMACRLVSAAHANDLVTRLGSDSFAVLFTDVASQIDAIARTRALMAALAEPLVLDGVRFEIGATAGVAVAPSAVAQSRDDQDPRHVEELLRRADVAVNEAKRDGVAISVFARARDTADVERLSLSAELRLAVAAQQFAVVFQPIVDLASGKALSAEGLARWQHPQHGSLPPHRFLDSIERSGLLAAFTAQVLDASLRAARAWRDAGFHMPVAVNVSPRSLLDPDFPASIPLALAAHGLPPDALTLELTETLTLSQLEVVDDVLHALRGIGVQLALDDFGTGFSSLATIARVPVNELKIDRAFVAGMSGAAEGAIVKSTVDLGRRLDLLVVAEGVETPAQREQLWSMGCPAGQGHLFGRPMTLEAFLAALRQGADGVSGRLIAPIQPPAAEDSPASAELEAGGEIVGIDGREVAEVISLRPRRAAG